LFKKTNLPQMYTVHCWRTCRVLRFIKNFIWASICIECTQCREN
jgi:hypothetical protein